MQSVLRATDMKSRPDAVGFRCNRWNRRSRRRFDVRRRLGIDSHEFRHRNACRVMSATLIALCGMEYGAD